MDKKQGQTLDFHSVASDMPGMDARRFDQSMQAILTESLKAEGYLIIEGWDFLLQDDASHTVTSVKKQWDELSEEALKDVELLETICPDASWEVLLTLAARTLRAGDLERAMAQYSVLAALRPQAYQPLIAYAFIIESVYSVQLAADFYRAAQSYSVSPTFSYHAALCFQRAEALPEARNAIQEAVNLLEDPDIGLSLTPDLSTRIMKSFRYLMSEQQPESVRI